MAIYILNEVGGSNPTTAMQVGKRKLDIEIAPCIEGAQMVHQDLSGRPADQNWTRPGERNKIEKKKSRCDTSGVLIHYYANAFSKRNLLRGEILFPKENELCCLTKTKKCLVEQRLQSLSIISGIGNVISDFWHIPFSYKS